MKYYQFNIGDYRRDTTHLSPLEHGIYRILLDSYYDNEGPLPADDAKLMRTHCIRTAEEVQAYKNIINDFFYQDGEVYRQDGADKVLASILEKSDKARAAAERRWQRERDKNSKRNASAMRTHSERNANGMLPITHNPIPNTPPNPPEGEPEGFAEFWKAYPRKTGKGNARKAWKKIRPSQTLQKKIMAAVDQQRRSQQWTRDDGKYIPHPTTWLNQERWDDEPDGIEHKNDTPWAGGI